MSEKQERGFLGIFFKSQPEPEPEPPKPKRKKKAYQPDSSVIDAMKAEIAELRDMITREQAPVAVEAEEEPEPVEDEDDA